MKKPEEALQKACVEWFRFQYPNKIIYHIPNSVAFASGRKGKCIGVIMKLKSLGLKKGILDLCIPHAVVTAHGLYIEMKIPGKHPTPDQRDVHDKLRENGYVVDVCKTFEEFTDSVNQYFSAEGGN